MIPTTGSYRILQERCGKVSVSCREISGPWKQYFRLEFSDDSRTDPPGKHWNLSESTEKKSERFLTGIILLLTS
jgi:hypothetical protein